MSLGLSFGVDALGGFRVETHQDLVEPAVSVLFVAQLQAFAQRFGALGAGEEAVDQGFEVEAGAPGHDGRVAACGDLTQCGAACSAVIACVVRFRRVDHVDEVVWNALAVSFVGLGRANLHVAIDGDRVAAYDFAVVAFGEMQR